MILLAIDAGNTNTVLGLFEDRHLKRTWRIPSTPAAIQTLTKKLSAVIESVIVSSVVPDLKRSFEKLSAQVCGRTPFYVSDRLNMPIRVKLPHPKQLGQDRIVNAAAAHTLYHGGKWRSRHLLVVDFGTATTIDVIAPKGDYIGGTISPGIGIANASLHEKTALLPLVPIKKPVRAVGNTTLTAIQSGVFYGYAGLIDGLVHRINKELRSKSRVIATGGLATVIGPSCSTIDIVDPDLTLKGLQRLHEWNHPKPTG
jgi:type III pantothenate kinase